MTEAQVVGLTMTAEDGAKKNALPNTSAEASCQVCAGLRRNDPLQGPRSGAVVRALVQVLPSVITVYISDSPKTHIQVNWRLLNC